MKLKTIAAAATALVAVGVGATINPGTASAHNATVSCQVRGTLVQSNDYRTAVTITYSLPDGTVVASSTVAAAPSSTPVTSTLAYPATAGGALATRWVAVWPDGFRQPATGTSPIPGTCTPTTVPPTTTTTTVVVPQDTTTAPTAPATTSPTTEPATTVATTVATTAPTTAAPTTQATTQATTAPTSSTTTRVTVPVCTVPGHPEQPPIKCPGGTSTTVADTTTSSVADTPTDESTSSSAATQVGDATDTDTTASTQAPADSSVGGSAANDQPVVTALAKTGADGSGGMLLGAGLLTLVGIGLVLTVRLSARARLD